MGTTAQSETQSEDLRVRAKSLGEKALLCQLEQRERHWGENGPCFASYFPQMPLPYNDLSIIPNVLGVQACQGCGNQHRRKSLRR